MHLRLCITVRSRIHNFQNDSSQYAQRVSDSQYELDRVYKGESFANGLHGVDQAILSLPRLRRIPSHPQFQGTGISHVILRKPSGTGHELTTAVYTPTWVSSNVSRRQCEDLITLRDHWTFSELH